jgi:hypothetical protein
MAADDTPPAIPCSTTIPKAVPPSGAVQLAVGRIEPADFVHTGDALLLGLGRRA